MLRKVTKVSKMMPDASAMHIPGNGGRKKVLRRIKPPAATRRTR